MLTERSFNVKRPDRRRKWALPTPLGHTLYGMLLRTRRELTALLAAGFALAGAACLDPPDTVLAQHELFVVAAHDSAHVRTLAIEAGPNSAIDARVQPQLLLESGDRISFSSKAISADGTRYVEAPTARVLLSSPVNGVLRLSVCKDGETQCSPVSVSVQTRGRKARSRT
jgi:hypothetical protein